MKTKLSALLMLTLLAAGPVTAPVQTAGALRIVEVKVPAGIPAQYVAQG